MINEKNNSRGNKNNKKPKRNWETFQENEEKFRLAFHTSPDSINLNRLEDGLYIDINDGFSEIMGYTREEVIGKTSLALNPTTQMIDSAESQTKTSHAGLPPRTFA